MFKNFLQILVLTLVMVCTTATAVMAQPYYYEDTKAGKEKKEQIALLEAEYELNETMYEDEEFEDSEAQVYKDNGLYYIVMTCNFGSEKSSELKMWYVYYDVEFTELKEARVYVDGELAAYQNEDDDELIVTDHGKKYDYIVENA